MTLRGVVFDLDGTLVDSEPLWARAEAEVAASRGIEWTTDEAFAWFGKPLARTTQAIIDKGLDLTVDEAIDRMLETMSAFYRDGLPWLPGSFELLQQLRDENLPAALGTMSYRRLASYVPTVAPENALRAIVAGDEIERGKPDPEVFVTAARRLGLSPSDVVVIEDSPTGVTAGIASGAPVVAVPPTEAVYQTMANDQPASFVRSLTQVDPALLRAIHASSPVDLWHG